MRLRMKEGPHAGKVRDEPRHLAEMMIHQGQAERVREDLRITDLENAALPVPSTPEKGSSGGLSSKPVAELAAMAKAQGLEVKRGDGKSGKPRKADFLAALGG